MLIFCICVRYLVVYVMFLVFCFDVNIVFFKFKLNWYIVYILVLSSIVWLSLINDKCGRY